MLVHSCSNSSFKKSTDARRLLLVMSKHYRCHKTVSLEPLCQFLMDTLTMLLINVLCARSRLLFGKQNRSIKINYPVPGINELEYSAPLRRKIIFNCVSYTMAMGTGTDVTARLEDSLFDARHRIGRRGQKAGILGGEHG